MLSLTLPALCCYFILGTGVHANTPPPHNYGVTRYVALGDSFSANPGAGVSKLGPPRCSVFDECFPQQLFDSAELVPKPPHDVQATFLMCSGAKLKDINDLQIPRMPTHTNFVTLTAGGNDVGFSYILDACIYGFFYRGCAAAMKFGHDHIDDPDFAVRFHNTLDNIFNRAPNANIYVLGYPTFFVTDTDQCSGTCFNVNPFINCRGFKLTRERRTAINNLSLKLNHKIRDVVEQHHGSLIYLETGTKFDGHRFCEHNVTEPNYDNPNIWFYPFTYFPRPWIAQLDEAPCKDSDTLRFSALGDIVACGIAKHNSTYVNILDHEKKIESHLYPDPGTNSGSINAPDFITRLFHPVIKGAGAYKDVVIEEYQGT